MKPIEKDELFAHLSGFLKGKGVELKEGSYVQGLQKSCSLLTDAINLGQKGIGRAKVKMDQALEQMRQTIHEKTAPKEAAKAEPAPASAAPPPVPPASGSAAAKPPRAARKAVSAKRKPAKKPARKTRR